MITKRKTRPLWYWLDKLAVFAYNIIYIGVRKDTRWGTRDGRVKPDYDRYHTDIHVVFKGGDESLHYHGETGERLPE